MLAKTILIITEFANLFVGLLTASVLLYHAVIHETIQYHT